MENCSIVTKPAMHLVGISFCGPFSALPDETIRLQSEFLARKHELNGAELSSVLYCPYFANESFAAYWACVEVKNLLPEVPDGMVQFTIPEHQYAVVAVSRERIGEGYSRLFAYMEQENVQRDDKAVSVELYYFDESLLEEEPVELLIPLQT